MRVLITGGSGQLATELTRLLAGRDVRAPNHAELDVTATESLHAAMDRFQPDVLINTAAYHQVDLCEREPEQAFLVNAAAPQRLAAACRDRGTLCAHLSTDYVFPGNQRTPYVESDPVEPVSVYGASKAAGELAVRATTDRHLIVRTTGLFGVASVTGRRGNFVETMLRLARTEPSISVVADQVLTPSYTGHVAAAIIELIDRNATGTFHVTNGGQCSWYEFAAEIFRQTGQQIDLRPTTQAQRPTPARRPAFSVLDHRGLRQLGIPELPSWQVGLREYLAVRSRIPAGAR
jgi:dTDP-4-dehydrorhamnose reductase